MCKISEKESTHNNEGSLSFVVWEESHFFRVKGGGKSDCYRSRPLFVVTCKCLEICGYMLTIAFLKQLRDVTYFLLIKIFFFLRLQTNNINNSLFGEATVKKLSGILKANTLVCCSFFSMHITRQNSDPSKPGKQTHLFVLQNFETSCDCCTNTNIVHEYLE